MAFLRRQDKDPASIAAAEKEKGEKWQPIIEARAATALKRVMERDFPGACDFSLLKCESHPPFSADGNVDELRAQFKYQDATILLEAGKGEAEFMRSLDVEESSLLSKATDLPGMPFKTDDFILHCSVDGEQIGTITHMAKTHKWDDFISFDTPIGYSYRALDGVHMTQEDFATRVAERIGSRPSLVGMNKGPVLASGLKHDGPSDVTLGH